MTTVRNFFRPRSFSLSWRVGMKGITLQTTLVSLLIRFTMNFNINSVYFVYIFNSFEILRVRTCFLLSILIFLLFFVLHSTHAIHSYFSKLDWKGRPRKIRGSESSFLKFKWKWKQIFESNFWLSLNFYSDLNKRFATKECLRNNSFEY